MDRKEISSHVQGVIIEVLEHDKFNMSDELKASDVEGWDSLTHMLIISGVEKKLGVKFKLKELNKLKNMGSLLDLIEEKI